MHRISTLLQRLTEMVANEKEHGLIDIDLMLDYTRVVYADLMEVRKNVAMNEIVAPPETEVPREKFAEIADEELEEIMENQEPVEAEKPIAPELKYADVPSIDIRAHIGINDKYLFISELFKDDKSAYDEAIKKLNTFTCITDAESWVKEELDNKHGWDDTSETVKSFYTLLNNSFPSI